MGRGSVGRLLSLADAGQKAAEANSLIKDIQRNTYEGIGKPEPLKGDLSGWWSRRIDDTHRIVYREQDGNIIIASCYGHYTDT